MSTDHTGISSEAMTTSENASDTGAEAAPAQPTCARCHDMGYYLLDVPVTDPRFGVLMTCVCKQAYLEQRTYEERLLHSHLKAFEEKTFETFNPMVPGVQDAYRYALQYASQHPFEGWLVLFGDCGCGKTHLAAAIANRALQRNYRVIFAVVPDLLDHLRSTFGPNSDIAYDEQFETIREVPVLVLDDLGTENTTPWAREKLYQIINHRYNYRLPTIITINRKLEEIEPRILSRLSDRSLHEGIVDIKAGDYRRQRPDQRASKRRR